MDGTTILWIVVALIVLLAIAWLIARRTRERTLQAHRDDCEHDPENGAAFHWALLVSVAGVTGTWNLCLSGPLRTPSRSVCAGQDWSARPSSATDFSRISTLRTFPVTVIGNSSTMWTYRGIL